MVLIHSDFKYVLWIWVNFLCQIVYKLKRFCWIGSNANEVYFTSKNWEEKKM